MVVAAIYAPKAGRLGEVPEMNAEKPRPTYRHRAWKEIKSEGPFVWLMVPLMIFMAGSHIERDGWQAALLSVQGAVYVAISFSCCIYSRIFTLSCQLHTFQDTIDQILTNPDAPEDTPRLSEAAVRLIRRSLQLDT